MGDQKEPTKNAIAVVPKAQKPPIVGLAYHRVNYLLQAAVSLTATGNADLKELGRFYVATGKEVARKGQVKINSDWKRLCCRRCHSLLLPGCSSTVKSSRKGSQKRLVHTCSSCKERKIFPTDNREYQIWTERNHQ